MRTLHANIPVKALSFFSALLIAGFLYSCDSGAQSTASAAPEATEEASEEEEGDDLLSFTPERIEEIKNQFIHDEENGIYYHSRWNKAAPKRSTLTCDVNADGTYFLSSVFYHPEGKGMKHRQVEVTIADTTFKSAEVPTSDDRNVTTKDGNSVFEVVTYPYSLENYELFQALATADDSPVALKFVAPKAYFDTEMNKSDLRAIRECFQLSILIRQNLLN